MAVYNPRVDENLSIVKECIRIMESKLEEIKREKSSEIADGRPAINAIGNVLYSISGTLQGIQNADRSLSRDPELETIISRLDALAFELVDFE